MNPDLTALYKKQYETLSDRLSKMDAVREGVTPEALKRVSVSGRVEGENPMTRIEAGMNIGNTNNRASVQSMQLQMEALNNLRDTLLKQKELGDGSDTLSQADLQKEYLKGNNKIGVDPKSGKLSIKYDQEPGSDANSPESKEAATKLRTEYINQSKTNGFIEVKNQYDKIKTAPDTAAGDLSLIFAYMKILDPNSTVREGEFANAQNTAGVPGQIVNAYNKALSGKRLNSEQRDQFKSAASLTYNSHVKTQKQLYDFYKKQAEEYGVDPEDAIGIFGEIKEEKVDLKPVKKTGLFDFLFGSQKTADNSADLSINVLDQEDEALINKYKK